MPHEAINFRQKPGLFGDYRPPKVIAEMNDYQFKPVKLQGDFVWHEQPDTGETFIALDGELCIEFEDGRVDLKSGEMCVESRGTRHRPRAGSDARVLLIEPRGAVDTGESGGELTAPGGARI